MKRRLLLVIFLWGAAIFVLTAQPNQKVRADACDGCWTTYQSCMNSSAAAYDACVSDGNPESICQDGYQMYVDNCAQQYSGCVNANCGGGGGGGGGCNEGKAYQKSCVSSYCPMLASCKDGSDPDSFGCQGLTGDDLDRCCNAEYETLMNDAVCDCNPYNDAHHH